jgi:hypothetical protein
MVGGHQKVIENAATPPPWNVLASGGFATMLTVAAACDTDQVWVTTVGLTTAWLTNVPVFETTGSVPVITIGSEKVSVMVTVATVGVIVAGGNWMCWFFPSFRRLGLWTLELG